MDDEDVLGEIRLFIENPRCRSLLRSDHVLNLLPEDNPRLLGIIDDFLALDPRARQALLRARRALLEGGLI